MRPPVLMEAGKTRETVGIAWSEGLINGTTEMLQGKRTGPGTWPT